MESSTSAGRLTRKAPSRRLARSHVEGQGGGEDRGHAGACPSLEGAMYYPGRDGHRNCLTVAIVGASGEWVRGRKPRIRYPKWCFRPT